MKDGIFGPYVEASGWHIGFLTGGNFAPNVGRLHVLKSSPDGTQFAGETGIGHREVMTIEAMRAHCLMYGYLVRPDPAIITKA